jgi:hypothetical protein
MLACRPAPAEHPATLVAWFGIRGVGSFFALALQFGIAGR